MRAGIFKLWIGWNRYMRRQKLQSLVSIICLAVGMTCFALSALWLRYIESFEDFVPDAERVYLVGTKHSPYNQGLSTYHGPGVTKDYMVANFPEVECATRFMSSRTFYDPKSIVSERDPQRAVDIEYAKTDSMTLRIFGIDVISGRDGEIRDGEIVLTRNIANKLFDTTDCIGETLLIKSALNDETAEKRIVVGVVEDWPQNSQFRFDAMIGSEYDESNKYDQWYTTIVKLHKGADLADVYKRIEQSSDTEEGYGAFTFSKDLMPIKSLRSEYPNRSLVLTRDYARVFMILGLLVIICALVNYMITTVTNMRNRSRTMSLYRLLGASTVGIIIYNILDWLMLFLVSAIIGIAIVCFLLPGFKVYADIEIPNSMIYVDVVLYLSVVFVVGALLSAVTTAIVLSRGQRNVLQGHQSHSSSTKLDIISNTMQLTLCLLVSICVSTIMAQIYYLKKTDALGFSRDRIVVFNPITAEMAQKVTSNAMIDGYLQQHRCLYPQSLYKHFYGWGDKDDIDRVHTTELEEIEIDKPLFDFWGMSLIDGRLPRPNCNEVAVSEATVNLFGWAEPLKSSLYIQNGYHYAVVGVIKDIYLAPPTMPVTPYVFTNIEESMVTGYDEAQVLSVKTKPGMKDEFIALTTEWVVEEDSLYTIRDGDPKNRWWKVSSAPGDVEAEYNMMLAKEEKLVNMLLAVAIASMVVSLIGIYSTLALTLQKRRKEIALRKIHGAKSRIIVCDFLKTNLISLVVATAISVPVSYIVMTRWLEAYQKHIAYPWWLAVAVFVLLSIMIYLTVIRKVYKVSNENPAEVIKEN